MRYDLFVAKTLRISRNKALELIQKEEVMLNKSFFKAAFDVSQYARNTFHLSSLSDEELLRMKNLNLELFNTVYVSRGALKLKNFLCNLNIKLQEKTCLDIGSSTGGFVQVLLENNVRSVSALDVGQGQLHSLLRQDKRVKLFENTDIRVFKSDTKFDCVTVDVSFISLQNLLVCIDNLALCDIVLLFKPQFEVGREAKRNKKGVVLDEKAVQQARKKFEKSCGKLGWILQNSTESSIKGKEGNVEYFYHYKK
ncbi:TlyA family RNA methyltransferase [Campylobacter sp. MIT 21-1685]|uniref:23S rRNA (cytidine-2'-O)-methyltransferase TlyA n=1 Tax=unclassified Campylobacter TaxID=2593542 RepID=UPI00224AF7DE|nr:MULTISPECIES: TlyA family RNA methyltransferase [unclassified Campylobacter]MCX2682355.1 TlyA family RNA methyltransferase [Campylobacter sp. MIT 21-1684]MCX2750635.1 TlyA family RNA methyltransferase [Campylobacter sp. MIT 21-1682]MCX2806817.1 TlyA family RNA methyltransferase [Campylobacter sp. MIT 21-1685]